MFKKAFDKLRTISKLQIEAAPPIDGRHGMAIVSMIKNVETYVGEWLRFHHAAGVRHFILYDNGSTDGTVERIQAALPAETYSIIPWRFIARDPRAGITFHNQVLAFSHAFSNFAGQYRWMSCVDIDEFLIPTEHKSIPEALEAIGDFSNISLPWQMFGTSGFARPPDGGVLQNYLMRERPGSEGALMRSCKCVVDGTNVTSVRVHSYETADMGDQTANTAGHLFKNDVREGSAFHAAGPLRLHHYYTLSQAEFDAKMARGSVDPKRRGRYAKTIARVAADIQRDEVEDRTALQFLDRIGVSPNSLLD